MPEILPRHYIIGIIIFTFIIVGGISILSEVDNYMGGVFSNDPKFTEFNETFNKYNSVVSEVDAIKKRIENAEPDQTALGALGSLISTSWNSLRLTFSSFEFFTDSLTGLTSIFFVPSWIVGLLFAIIIIIIGFSIYSAIFQRDI